MLRKTITIIAVTALLLTDAEGASLTNVQGAVTVSNGSGVIRASDGLALPPGAVVRTGDGTANIAYENGCMVPVGPRQMISVAEAPPCNGSGFDLGSMFDDVTTGDLLTDVAVVLGLVAIIVAIAVASSSKRSTSSTSSTTGTGGH
ncbi:MAG: hypothetical protein WBX25_07820 [Rhodomicrobium sp.]